MKNKDLNNKTQNMPIRRISVRRVLAALVLFSAIGFSLNTNIKEKVEIESIQSENPWFASYVDVTATPQYAFEQLGSTSTPNVVLSFIVSANSDPCSPTWGTYYTLNEAAVSLDLDRRIARLRQKGGNIAISFGGAINNELAIKCTNSDKLFNAYKTVVERYDVSIIDIDLENDALRDRGAMERRAKAIAKLQHIRRDEGKGLAVWLTLPVTPQGLLPEGTDTVSEMLRGGVDLTGVNIMTMDYGESKDKNHSMLEASIKALTETHRQIGILYKQYGLNLGNSTLWRKMGATPMIGQNDVPEEVFSIDDAKGLNEFALGQGVGRMSMWSANRDIPCGENYVNLKIVSDSCSGVNADKYSFAQFLSYGFTGNLSKEADLITINEPEDSELIIDDPDNSPYQIWHETGAYPKGVKVVWKGNVYEAKWWTKNDLPDNPVLQSWETPWQLLGPVLPGEKPVKQPTLPSGTYPNWSGVAIYDGGDRVLFEGIPFQAKWWNQGHSPAATAANSDSSPWLPLSQAEILKILESLDQDKIDLSKV